MLVNHEGVESVVHSTNNEHLTDNTNSQRGNEPIGSRFVNPVMFYMIQPMAIEFIALLLGLELLNASNLQSSSLQKDIGLTAITGSAVFWGGLTLLHYMNYAGCSNPVTQTMLHILRHPSYLMLGATDAKPKIIDLKVLVTGACAGAIGAAITQQIRPSSAALAGTLGTALIHSSIYSVKKATQLICNSANTNVDSLDNEITSPLTIV
jgi:hypothetical protein